MLCLVCVWCLTNNRYRIYYLFPCFLWFVDVLSFIKITFVHSRSHVGSSCGVSSLCPWRQGQLHHWQWRGTILTCSWRSWITTGFAWSRSWLPLLAKTDFSQICWKNYLHNQQSMNWSVSICVLMGTHWFEVSGFKPESTSKATGALLFSSIHLWRNSKSMCSFVLDSCVLLASHFNN